MDNKTRLLVLAAEDFTGLWDAALELAHERSAEDAARQALEELASDGLIELFAGGDPARAELQALDRAEVPEALGPGPQWAVPGPRSEGPYLYFATTDAGLALIQQLHWGEDS